MNRHDLPHTLSSDLEHKAIVNGCWRCDKMAKPITDERTTNYCQHPVGVKRVCLVRCKAIGVVLTRGTLKMSSFKKTGESTSQDPQREGAGWLWWYWRTLIASMLFFFCFWSSISVFKAPSWTSREARRLHIANQVKAWGRKDQDSYYLNGVC